MPTKLRFVEERPDESIEAVRATAEEAATANWTELSMGGFNPQGNAYGYGDLRMTHLTLTNTVYFGQWTTPTIVGAGVETNWFNTIVHRNQYTLIHGMFNLTPIPRIQEGKFYFGGNDLAWYNPQEMYSWDVNRYHFESGFVISPGQAIRGTLTTDLALINPFDEQIGLIGEVLAKRSYLIQYNAPVP